MESAVTQLRRVMLTGLDFRNYTTRGESNRTILQGGPGKAHGAAFSDTSRSVVNFAIAV